MKSIAFIHLDLGIGGAENLVVNAARGMSDRKYDVTVYTSFHDKNRAFKETTDGTLKVVVFGSWLPRQLFGRFTILMSTIRMLYICVCLFVTNRRFDVVFSDQVSVTNVAVRLFGLARKKTVFYCHYPDVLLCTNRVSVWRRSYRVLFDWLERTTTGMCDVLIVNSEFTASQLRLTFPNLKNKIHVLYPPVTRPAGVPVSAGKEFFFSLNRFERKKDLPLVVKQFAKIVSEFPHVGLVMAGGFDSRLAENESVYSELCNLIVEFGLSQKVQIFKNLSEQDRQQYLANCAAVVYSPQWEHFGIVPVEAMAVGTPVIAWNNGGPKESVVDGKTGILCNEEEEFSRAMRRILKRGKMQAKTMRKNCKQRVAELFSLECFAQKLEEIC